jgi:hypothetical protein
MKPILMALLFGLFAPLYGQQQFCFSKSCPQTPETVFMLDRSDRQLSTIFLPLPTLPAYEPVAPLALSPSTRQFFQYSAPTDGNSLGLASPESSRASTDIRHGGTTGTHSSHGLNPSHTAGPTFSTGGFSTGQGGIGFTPTSPKF